MANLKDLIVNGVSRVLGKAYFNGSIDVKGNIECTDGKVKIWNASKSNYGEVGLNSANAIALFIQSGEYAGLISEGGFWSFAPSTNFNLGSDSKKWRALYATSGTIITSDKNEKNTIKDLSESLSKDFVLGLKPVSFKYNDGTSDRTHYGLISQDVESLINDLGMTSTDFAGFIKSPKRDENDNIIEGEYSYGLRYEEFISPLIKTVQTQQKEIEELKAVVKELQNK